MQKVPPCSPSENLHYQYPHEELLCWSVQYIQVLPILKIHENEQPDTHTLPSTISNPLKILHIYMLFDISQSIFLGVLPPVDLQAVCFVRTQVWTPPYIPPSPLAVAWQARSSTGVREWRQHSTCKQPPSVFLNVVSTASIFCFVLEPK